MSDEDFKSENIFPQIKAVQETGTTKFFGVNQFSQKCTDQNCQIPFICLDVGPLVYIGEDVKHGLIAN